MAVCKENEFCEDYLILKPEKAGLVDLFSFLLPFRLKKKTKFIDCPEGKEDSYRRRFGHRWLIFASIVVQIILVAIATPLTKLDAFLAYLFNFIFCNGGIRALLFKILKLKSLAKPDKNSPEYKSVLGFLDWRRELDKSIKPNDTFRYYANLTIMAAKASYESKPFVQSIVTDCWKMKFLGHFKFWNDFQTKAKTQAFMFQNTATDPNIIVVAFKGTSPLDTYDWQVDVDFSWYYIKGVGSIHSGFMKALGLQRTEGGWPKELARSKHDFAYYTLRQKLRDIAKSNNNAKFIITGHSLGGALATLFVTILALHEDSVVLDKLHAVYTYGQPRVGDQHFAKFMVNTIQKYGFKYYRYVYSVDLVPRVPFDSIILKFKHFDKCIYFNSLYKGRILNEQLNKNYFSLIWVIPKYLNAWWEFIRSFMLPFVKGFDYHESLLMMAARVVGLFIPGLTAHIPTDYVNSTRLGKLKEVENSILGNCIEPDY